MPTTERYEPTTDPKEGDEVHVGTEWHGVCIAGAAPMGLPYVWIRATMVPAIGLVLVGCQARRKVPA